MVGEKRKRAQDDDPFESSSKNPSKKASLPKNLVVAKKPLSSKSQKVILQYMEANKRFQLSRLCPKLRPLSSSVPLTIDTLSFGQMSMTVNGVKYQLGIHREFHNRHETYQTIQEANDRGGVRYDLDPYGFRDDQLNWLMTPGDISFEEQGEPPEVWSKNTWFKRYANVKKFVKFGITKTEVNYKVQDEFLLLENRVNEKLPPYESFIQLTITGPDRATIVQNAPYFFRNLEDDEESSEEGSEEGSEEDDSESEDEEVPEVPKLYKAFKNLTTNLFRAQSIRVKKLQFMKNYERGEYDSCNKLIYDYDDDSPKIRLPEGLQLKVDKLRIDEDFPDTILTKITPILHPSLQIIIDNDAIQLQHPIIQNSLQLVIRTGTDVSTLTSHRNIHVLNWNPIFFGGLINRWESMNPGIGACMSVNLVESRGKSLLFGLQKGRPVTIAYNELSEIKITDEGSHPADDVEESEGQVILMEVVPAGTV